MFTSVDHIAYNVGNLDDYVAFMENILGLRPEVSEVLTSLAGADPAAPRKPARVVNFRVGETRIQAHDPTFSAPGAKHFEQHGPGVGHVAWSVDNLEELARRLKANGISFRTTGVPNGIALGAASALPSSNPGVTSFRSIGIEPDDNPLGILFEFVEAGSNAPRG